MKNTKLTHNQIRQIFFGTLFFVAVLLLCLFLPSVTHAADTGYVNASDLNVRTKPSTSGSSVVGTISYTNVTILGSTKDSNGDLWYKISYAGGEYYIFGLYVTVSKSSGSSTTAASSSSSSTTSYGTYKQQLASFPKSYQSLIQAIHKVYPNYIFEANNIDMKYDDVVYQQTLDHRKTVSMDYDGVSWRSLSPACYNKKTKTWSTFSGNWTDAGIDVIEYYIDPRNFLTTRNMYIFAKQTYTGTESRSGVESIAGGSFLAGTYKDSTGKHSYIDTIMQVAKESNVSPYVIAATLRQEQPTSGKSALIDGSKGYYNFFNFGASGSDVIGNGIAYAKKQGWDTVYKSILGGAKSYYNGYLKYGQDTYYYKDFNVTNLDFNHQYAQGVYDQIGSGSFLRTALGDDTSATLVLRIPVYKEMAETAPGYPPETSKLNARYDKNGKVIPRTKATISSGSGSSGSSGTPASSGSEVTTANGKTSSSSKKSSPKYKAGDANGDGKITALDYVAIKNHLMKKKVIKNKDKLLAADANSDGKVSALDYVKVKKKILKKQS